MRKLLPGLVVVAVAMGVVGCSDDDDGPDAAPSGTVSTSTTVHVLSADEIDPSTPYCATWKEIRSAGGPQTEGLSDEDAAARRKHYYGSLVPLVERLLTQSTGDIRSE